MNEYLRHGYNNRSHYLLKMSEHYRLRLDFVKQVADILGQERDFDGLEELIVLSWKTVVKEEESYKMYVNNMMRLGGKF